VPFDLMMVSENPTAHRSASGSRFDLQAEGGWRTGEGSGRSE
jgi:hypothetical protein